jgi:ribonuclease VapC
VIIDSSALLAVVLLEADLDRYLDAMLAAERRMMSAANWFEATMVIESRGDATGRMRFDEFVRMAEIELVPVSVAQAGIAREAWRTFGCGKHKARLNFGDCFAYALAKDVAEPLLFKGDDFTRTDIEPALKG